MHLINQIVHNPVKFKTVPDSKDFLRNSEGELIKFIKSFGVVNDPNKYMMDFFFHPGSLQDGEIMRTSKLPTPELIEIISDSKKLNAAYDAEFKRRPGNGQLS